MANNTAVTKQDITTLQETLLTTIQAKYATNMEKEIKEKVTFGKTDAFINDLDRFASKLIDSVSQTKIMTEYPHLKGVAPLFGQAGTFIKKFSDVMKELQKVNMQYMTLAWSSQEKRIKDCQKTAEERRDITKSAIDGRGERRTLGEVQQIVRNMSRRGPALSREQEEVLRQSLHRGGSKHENIFIKNFKKTLVKLDKILENTKLSVTDKEKKLQKVMNHFNKYVDNQVVKFKKMTEKSTKKTNKIIKRSINKLRKLRKLSKNTKKKVTQPIKKKLTKKPLRKTTTKNKTRKN
jgi:hypothetical protein